MKIEALAIQPILEADIATRALAKARARAFGEFVREIPFASALLDRDLVLVAVSREWAEQGIAPTLKPSAATPGPAAWWRPRMWPRCFACAEEGVAFSRYLP
jgi:hypothetical protein